MRLIHQSAFPLPPLTRAPPPTLLFELPGTSTPGLAAELRGYFPQFKLGLLSQDRVPEAAELLVDSFFLARPVDGGGPTAGASNAASRSDRLQLTARGLEWRLGSRLQSPDLALSLESSLLLALSDAETGSLAACAELSLRPRECHAASAHAHTRPAFSDA